MSSVCGMADYSRNTVDFETLRSMGKAMLLRGRAESGAYINGGVALQHNNCDAGCESEERQPYTEIKGADAYTIAFDGEFENLDSLISGIEWESEPRGAARVALGYYLRYGCDCVKYFEGAFSFAIFDEKRNEVFLARDPEGKRPLYYSNIGGILVFASEIKGLLACMDNGAAVSTRAFARLMTAGCGEINGSDIFCGISELPPSSYAVYSDDGRFNVFAYFPFNAGGGKITGSCVTDALTVSDYPFEDDLEKAIYEILIAFDYPQFDAYILRFLSLIRKNSGKRKITVADEALSMSAAYSRERADRLGMRYSLEVNTVPLKGAHSVSFIELRRTEKKLRALAAKLLDRERENGILQKLIEPFLPDKIMQKRDIKQRIRMLGMLCQTVFWVEKYNIYFV